MTGSVECNAELLKRSPEPMCNKLAKGEGTALGWLIPKEQYPTPGTGGELKDHRATMGMIHTSLSFFSSSLDKIIFLELLIEKEAATLGGLFQSGGGKAGESVMVFQGGRTGFCTKRKAQVAGG